MLTIGAIFIGSYLGHEYSHSIKISGKKHDCIDKKIMFLEKNSNGKKRVKNIIVVSQESLARNASYGYCKYNLTIEITYDDTNILDQIDFSDHYTSNDQAWLKSEDIEKYHSDYDNENHLQKNCYYKKILEPKFSLSNQINPYQLTVNEFNLLVTVKTHADKSNLSSILGNLILYIIHINPNIFHKHMKYPELYPLYMILREDSLS